MVANRHLEKQYLKNVFFDFSRILVCWYITPRPSLIAIKCTVIYNKTANTHDKNCSLSSVLTATHQKLTVPQQLAHAAFTHWIILPVYQLLKLNDDDKKVMLTSRWHVGGVMVGNIPFIWFLQFLMRGC